MLEIGGSKLNARVPYWDMPSLRDLDIYFDATRQGFKKKPTWGNDLASVITDTHNDGNAMVQNAAGVWVPKAANVLSLEDTGLWTYPTRTNSVRNNSMSGAVVGSPGTLPSNWAINALNGLSREVIATGTINGLPYIDIRVYGTTSSAGTMSIVFDSTRPAATVAQVWTSSAWLARIAGTLPATCQINIVERGTAGSFEAATATAFSANTGTLTRYEATRTFADADVLTAENILFFTLLNATVYDFTLRIVAPQLELGDYASPPILTTGAALARTGNASFIAGGLASSLTIGIAGFIKFDAGALTNNQRHLNISNGTDGERFDIDVSSGIFRAVIVSSLGASMVLGLGTASLGVKTIAFAAQSGFFRARMIGEPTVQSSSSNQWPIGLSGLSFNGGSLALRVYKKLGVKFGPQNQASFDAMYALALAA